MAHNVLYRDFNLCRAAVLAALIGLAWISGKGPAHHPSDDEAEIQSLLNRASVPVQEHVDAWGGKSL
ncbi:hypothetical protein [Thetidibacter halocola]|uniref:Uncharacterized protein n=1 Tax=Thetidibacter halocola TaxID=2827239 RepID=A0A8J7WA30_9RHOB|nr:hypothetical protein [Thetidibacter halocola]MBS0122714.1 hypothetical protein [Thetidibacter halocola]